MAETNHPVLKRLAAPFGITSSTALWRPFAIRQHRRKIDRDSAYRAWLQARSGLDEHWGHETVTDELGLLHMGSQLYEICRTLRARIGSAAGARVLDAGASDGLFLNEIGAVKGVGVNFLPACARKISGDEQLACVADVERLPFPDRAFDIVICCETLEHVPNPVSALNELARVCRGRLFVTIPWLPDTRINARPNGWPEVESHIFEFSEADFARVVSHAGVRVAYQDRIHVFPEPKDPFWRWWLGRWMYPNFFPKLQYYELIPVSR
jgi:SAM-dependent methyltransferase